MIKLKPLFNRINKTCFNNKLKPCKLKYVKGAKKEIAYFTSHYIPDTIKPDYNYMPEIAVIQRNYKEADLIKILIHEMTHYENWMTWKRKGKPHSKNFFLKIVKYEMAYVDKYKIKLNYLICEAKGL